MPKKKKKNKTQGAKKNWVEEQAVSWSMFLHGAQNSNFQAVLCPKWFHYYKIAVCSFLSANVGVERLCTLLVWINNQPSSIMLSYFHKWNITISDLVKLNQEHMDILGYWNPLRKVRAGGLANIAAGGTWGSSLSSHERRDASSYSAVEPPDLSSDHRAHVWQYQQAVNSLPRDLMDHKPFLETVPLRHHLTGPSPGF